MRVKYDYIQAIFSSVVIINCFNSNKKHAIKRLGAKRRFFEFQIWRIPYQKNNLLDLAKKLEKLRNLEFCFAGSAGGWPPAAVFQELRDKGYAHGKITEIMWRSPNQAVKREL